MPGASPEPPTLDVDAVRPPPRRPVGELVVAYLRWLGAGRILATAASVLSVVVGGWWLLRAPSPPVEASLPMASVSATTAAMTPAADTPESSGSAAEVVVVHVAGAVLAPGVVTLPAGSRVHEAVTAAGGLAPDAVADAVNLAAIVADGQQVYVPHAGEGVGGPASTATPTGSGSGPTGPVDLNHATAAELEVLPGIGPATAAAIVAHRDQHGPFASVEGLLDVPGIGPARLESLRELVTV